MQTAKRLIFSRELARANPTAQQYQIAITINNLGLFYWHNGSLNERRLCAIGSWISACRNRLIATFVRSGDSSSFSALSLWLATPRRLTDRQRHELSDHQVAESALIRNRAMAQQLCEHA